MKTNKLYKLIVPLLFLAGSIGVAWGQDTDEPAKGDKYSYIENGQNRTSLYDTIHIQHFHTKWHGRTLPSGKKDTYNDIEYDTNLYTNKNQQPAHHYVDTIYMKKGTSITLQVPDRNTGASIDADKNNKSYQRWYNYRTDGSFKTTETGTDDIIDILTPAGTFHPYRFANGYMGKPLTTSIIDEMIFYYPTDEENISLVTSQKDNDMYIVACDVSTYNDYDPKNEETRELDMTQNKFTEPTLTHRILFYIVGVDVQNNNGTSTATITRNNETITIDENFYHETFDISYPFTRISNKTLDLVALSKDADSYVFPDGSKGGLTATIKSEGNTAGITFSNSQSSVTLNGNTRVIQFEYPKTDDTYGTRLVNTPQDGSDPKATIEVTKTLEDGTTYNIATYNLTFVKHTVLLTQSIIEALDDPDNHPADLTGKPWATYSYRTPKALSEKYTLLTELNWDYSYHNLSYYAYPMDWDYSSYGFFDGDNSSIVSDRNPKYPEWGYYAITNGYIESTSWPTANRSGAPQTAIKNSEGNNSSYHLFVDASDRPGVIARLEFPQNPCPGSEIFVSAWVKSAASWEVTNNQGTSDDAAMLFTIMGVKEGTEGARDTYVPLYRHCTGQIRNTLYLNNAIPGCGTSDGRNAPAGKSSNEWLHLYFSFINPAQYEDYDHYVLQIDNYSASTKGGDMYLDDVRCYVMEPTAEVTQMEATCNKRTRMNIRLNWEQLLSRTQGFRDENSDAAIDFCFIDKDAYEAANPNDEAAAIKAAAVQIGDGDAYNAPFGTLYYRWHFEDEDNKNYTDAQTEFEDGALAKNNSLGSNYYFYTYTDVNNEQYLSVDFYSELSPLKEYIILLRDHQETLSNDNFASHFVGFSDPCAMKDTFTVQGQNVIQMNGQVINDSEDLDDYCTGQIFDFSVKLQIEQRDENGDVLRDEDGNVLYEEYDKDEYGTVYFDWFFGTMEDFNPTTTEESLYEALQAFRAEYSDAENLDNVTAKGDLTEAQITLLKRYVEENPDEGGIQHPLVLHQETLPIRILDEGLDLIVCPIDNLQATGGDDDAAAYRGLFCWTPIELHLDANGESPTLRVGFEDVTYPYDDEYNPGVRVGLAQIKAAQVSTNDTSNPTIKINLRDANYANTDSKAHHLGILGETKSIPYTMTDLHLVNTNDPNYTALVNHEEFDMHAYSIGTIVSLYAKPMSNGTPNEKDNILEVRFNLQQQEDIRVDNSQKFQFTPREGYYYTFGFHFEEKNSDNATIESAEGCYGSTVVTMHVVPEYQKWVGEATDNWNDDTKWARSSSTELKKDSEDYADYDDDDLLEGRMPGYVPMKFTNVTIPGTKDDATAKQIELYAASKNETASGNTHDILDLSIPTTNATGITGTATSNIEYDMLVNPEAESNAYVCEPYYTNKVNQIHFEPNAEMLHAELLTYDTAWVDYKLTKGEWYMLASPLQGVVAGDFYTDSDDATEKQEYFTPITFEKDGVDGGNDDVDYNNDGIKNSRFSPSVYQRGWNKDENGAQMITTGGTSSTRAIQGNWSAVYNNVYDEYKPGEGFSLKVLDMPDNNGTPVEDAIFRLPKADDSYNYYTVGDDNQLTSSENSNNGSMPDSRKNAGKLQITPDDDATESESLHIVTLSGDNQYYLIGNPFMAHLDAAKFFDVNKSVLEQKYWTVENDVQNVAASSDGEWESTTGTNIPTIAPLQSFFVQKADGAATDATVKFTADMQTLESTTEGTSTNALILTAQTADGKTSRAAIAYDSTAAATYAADEDAELFLDSNLSDVPAIYTVAGTMATSINRTSELYNIPVGIYGSSTEMVTLSFEGLNHFNSATLYDAEKKTETPLREGTTLTVPASTSGRYFLRAGTPTANEVIETSDIQIYTLSGNRVMVTSNVPLKDIRVYTMNGAQVKHTKAGVCSFELYLPNGIYLITAQNTSGETQTEKVVVR